MVTDQTFYISDQCLKKELSNIYSNEKISFKTALKISQNSKTGFQRSSEPFVMSHLAILCYNQNIFNS